MRKSDILLSKFVHILRKVTVTVLGAPQPVPNPPFTLLD